MREHFKNTGLLPISELMLDLTNFRHMALESQSECFKAILEDEKKILKLAEDVAKIGLTPDLIVLYKNPEGNWIVKEGNRRIAVLKILNNSSIVEKDTVRKKFDKLTNQYSDNIPNKVECIYCEDEEVILDYMDRLHAGEQEGIGRIQWNPENKGRYEQYRKRSSQYDLAIKAKDLAVAAGVELPDNYNISTLQRLLNNNSLKDRLKMRWENGEILFGFDQSLAKKVLLELVFSLAGKKVDDVKNTSLILEHAEKVLRKLKIEPDEHLTEYGPIPEGSTSSNDDDQQKDKKKYHRPPKASWDRPRLIPPRRNIVKIAETHWKERNILTELSSKVYVRESPLAAAVLLRMFLELSVDHYIKENGVRSNSDKPLGTKAVNAVNHMKQNDLITKKQQEGLTSLSRTDSLFSAPNLQRYVHSKDFYPDSKTLCIFWDNIELFVSLCWR